MLVVNRRIDEEVFVTTPDGTELRIVLCSVRGGSARLGFEAPKDYKILRGELRTRPRHDDQGARHAG